MLGKKHTKITKEKMSNSSKGLKGKNHPRWKGGKILVDGYIYIYSPTHPNKTKNGYILEHRLVMEKHIGRQLLTTEVVHHINGIKTDNRIENLILYSSCGEHYIKEHSERDIKGRFC